MGYRKADDILPKELLCQIQEYVDGETIYIPRKQDTRHEWGKRTHIREELALRNRKICKEYHAGTSVSDLAKKYFLSEKSIQRIIYSSK